MMYKDKRNKYVNEALQGIRVIKLFAWYDITLYLFLFSKLLSLKKGKELHQLYHFGTA